jgi:exodeoxyribonuclease III
MDGEAYGAEQESRKASWRLGAMRRRLASGRRDPQGCAMKIATYNVNNVRKRLPNLLAWLKAAQPDIVCLQELKATDKEFPADALARAGYHAVWRGEKTWNGVAILGRGMVPVVTRTELPGDGADPQSRYIEAAVNGIIIACVYLPNGNPQPGPKFDYKLAWFERLTRHAAELMQAGVPVALIGDFNVVPTPLDIYKTRSWDKDALLQPESRAAFAKLMRQGWTDAVRSLHPDAPMYSFWDYMRRRWEKDGGLRIDFILLTPDLAKRLKTAGVDRAERGKPNTSDHAPVWAVLAETGKRTRATTKAPRRKAATKRPLLIIDGDSFAHRSYHALPKTILRKGKKGAGAIVGFANYLLRLYQAEQPRAVIVGWDTLTTPTWRHKAFKPYQGGRVFDAALLEQLEILPELVAACGFVNAKKAGYEADDFLAAAVAAEERRGGTALVASGDRDTFQLASDRTTILFPARAGVIERIGPAQVRARYGVDPRQVPGFIALRGDPSDKLPGAPGVGPKGAADIVRRYGSLDAALEAGRLSVHAKALRLYREIATMDATAPLPDLADQQPSWESAAALARQWELGKLADRLEAPQWTS